MFGVLLHFSSLVLTRWRCCWVRKIPRGLPYKQDRAQLVAPNLLGYPVLDGTFSLRFKVSRKKYDWIKRVILELVSLSGEKKNSSHSHRILVPPMQGSSQTFSTSISVIFIWESPTRLSTWDRSDNHSSTTIYSWSSSTGDENVNVNFSTFNWIR